MPQLEGNHLRLILNDLIGIVNEASKKVMEIYDGGFDVQVKSDKSPVTDADFASNNILCEGVKELTPDIRIVSEESKELPWSERKDMEFCWIIDPLDGTKEFVRKNGEFAINVALCHRNRIILGVVGLPAKKATAWAMKGEGSYYQIENMPICRLSCTSYDPASTGVKIVTSKSHTNTQTQTVIDTFDQPQIIRKGSSIKMIEIAQGNAHYYPRLGPTMEWDTAAPQIILEEAGGSIIDFITKRPLIYNKESLYNPDFEALAMVKASIDD